MRGVQSEFVRTPKSGDVELAGSTYNLASIKKKDPASLSSAFYKAVKPRGAVIEFTVALIYVGVFIWAVVNGVWFMLPFLLFLVIGFFSASFHSMVSQSRLSS